MAALSIVECLLNSTKQQTWHVSCTELHVQEMFANFERTQKQRDTSIVVVSQSTRRKRLWTDTEYGQFTYMQVTYISLSLMLFISPAIDQYYEKLDGLQCI